MTNYAKIKQNTTLYSPDLLTIIQTCSLFSYFLYCWKKNANAQTAGLSYDIWFG